jgi:hypothetical protein
MKPTYDLPSQKLHGGFNQTLKSIVSVGLKQPKQDQEGIENKTISIH